MTVGQQLVDGEQIKTGALQDAIFNSAYFSSIATDERGVIQIFNVGAERMLGYAALDVVDRITPADISDPQELITRAAALSEELDTPITPGFEALVFKASRGIEDIYELTYVRKNGSRFPAMVSVTALRDAEEQIIGYLLIGTDNTARKEGEAAQARLDQQQKENIELEHASRMKSEFLATMSHELRTPLNAVIGFSEALKDGLMGEMTESQQEYIGDIFTSGQHLLSLINDILDLSKVEAGMMALELEDVEADQLLSGALSIVREKAAARRISLRLELIDHLGVSQMDVRKTKQIIYNLLSNAVKFSNDGGRVTLRAGLVPRSAVGTLRGVWTVRSFPLAENEFDEFLEICVTDGGMGISEENMAKLFQPFSQIDSSLARKFEGTGLGLAMVMKMAELLGGSVAVASREGEGACFAAWLPIRTSPEAASMEPALRLRPLHPGEDTERVALVIEDNDRSADLVRLLLEAEGFTVLLAASAEDALLIAPLQPLSLITLDVHLPGIDGWEFLATIREDDALAHVPIVIISGVARGNMALTAGAAAILQKPISRTELKASLARLGLQEADDQTQTVLIVDDDPQAVELIAALLPKPAYACVRAYTGGEAIILAQQLQPDLILLDLLMPDMNGFDVVAALQRNSETTRIPILVVTAKNITARDRDVLNADSDNVVQIIEKGGFDRRGFMAEVRRTLCQPYGA